MVEASTEDCELCIGKKFKVAEDLFKVYKAYGKRAGFAVRKMSSWINEDGVIRSLTYVCIQDQPVDGGQNPTKLQKSNRCECKAYITARLTDEDKLAISQLCLDHNHPISPSKTRHFHCRIRINPHAKHRLDFNDKTRIRINKIYLSLVNEAGGYDEIGCSEKDCRTVIEEIRRLRIGEGDAAPLMKYFSKKVAENDDFYFSLDYDEEDHLKNVFWADGWNREAYKEFGEVVSFDTTYLTNKYDMPFFPFVGVNNHGQSILLGCGLLLNESTDTFFWFFKKWLKCMPRCSPKTIITDQDKAMQKAIAIAFLEARRRWCLWHIMKKVPDKLRKYLEKEEIVFAFKDAIYDSQTPYEFEVSWKNMVDE